MRPMWSSYPLVTPTIRHPFLTTSPTFGYSSFRHVFRVYPVVPSPFYESDAA